MKNIELGHHWVPRILERLNKLAPIPDTGILAGQAVSSAILEELGLGPVVYNDIDIFKIADAAKKEELASVEFREAESFRLGIPVAELDEYRELRATVASSIDIVGSEEVGLINYVWCDAGKGKSLNGTRVLHSFDLNAVEVAIDLATKELLWSRAFEFFLKTRELQVTSLTTPARTLLRYFKKREELQAYGNDSLVLNLMASWVSANESYSHRHKKGEVLGAKFYHLAKAYEHKFSSVFDLDEEGKTLLSCVSWEHRVQGSLELMFKDAVETDELEGLARVAPLHAYGVALSRSKALDTSLKKGIADYVAEEDENGNYIAPTVVSRSLGWLQHTYLKDHLSDAHYALVNKTLAQHPELCTAITGLSLEEQYHCLKDIRSRAKREGEHIYGMVESNALPSDMWNKHHRDAFFKRIVLEESSVQLAPPLLPTKECEGVRVRELLTTTELRIEGSQMGHCVGGYGARISSGRSRVLSVRGRGGRAAWSTAEVAVVSEMSKLVLRQHYAAGNTKAPDENDFALKLYLEEQADALGYHLEVPRKFEHFGPDEFAYL